MKTRLLFISLLIIVATSHGQTIFLKFGPSYSKITYKSPIIIVNPEKTSKETGIIGFNVLAGVNYLNFKYFNLSSGIGFIQKGGEEDFWTADLDPSLHNSIFRLNFFTINTTFNLKIPIKEFIEPYIFFGPRLDYLFSYSDGKDRFIYELNYNKKLNSIIYGILFGGGINFKVKRFILGLNFDYYFNLNKLVDYYRTYHNQYSKEQLYDKTFTINALIGFKF